MLFKRRRLASSSCVVVITSLAGDAVGSVVLTSGTTVDVLKATVEAATNIPPAEQRLIFNKKELLNTHRNCETEFFITKDLHLKPLSTCP